MSGVAKGIKKVFKKVKPILKVAAIAAIIYFTAGAATGAFAAPAVGAGTAAASGTMAGGVAAAAGPTGAGFAGVGPGVASMGAGSALAATAPSIAAPVVASQLPAVAPALAAETGGGMMSWMQANPMATMMLGQGAFGAAQGYLGEKALENQEDRIDERRKDRGLMGFNYDGSPGIVASQTAPARVDDPAVPAATRPTVDNPSVAAQRPEQAQAVPIDRESLPDLKKKGYIT